MNAVTTAAPPTVELVPARSHLGFSGWQAVSVSVAAVILALTFLNDRTFLFGAVLVFSVLNCAVREWRLRYSLKRVTLPPAGAEVVDGENSFRSDTIFLAVAVGLCVFEFAWAVGGVAVIFGDALANTWESRRLSQFEQEKGRNLFRRKGTRLRWSLEYTALPQVEAAAR